MRVVEVPDAGAEPRTAERRVPEPSATEVRVAVEACGVCHGDRGVVEDSIPGIAYPRVPGHEFAGRVNAVGDRVTEWSVGDRVAVGWHGGHCGTCDQCRRGRFGLCSEGTITGASHDGGYAEYAVVPREALAAVPDALAPVHAGPLVCAGLTAFTALRESPARPGDTVAVQGIGGVGHMAIQFADAMGFETLAVSRTPEKREVARELGAAAFVDAASRDPGAALADRGGADLVLATAPNADAVGSVVDGLAGDGQLLVVAAPNDPVEIHVERMLGDRLSVRGWYAGHPGDAEDTMRFAARRGIEPRVETFDLSDAAAAHRAMLDNDLRFRAVLEP